MTQLSSDKIILTAGGTGGHIYPAEALAVELQKRNYQVMFFTDQRGLGNYQGILKQIPNQTIYSGSIIGKSILTKFISLIKLTFGTIQAGFYLLKNRPAVVVGFGGYASFPTALSAIILRIPLIIHEQNSVMSRTNRLLARFATRTAQSFRKTKNTPSSAKEFLCGMPIREAISQLYFQERDWKTQNSFSLIVLGGSQGAKILGEIVPKAISLLSPDKQKKLIIYQQCRKGEEDNIKSLYENTSCKYIISSFFNNMPELYQKSSLIISRAGASSIYEIAAAGIPSILIPLPTAADNHQYYNAKELSNSKGAILVNQSDFSSEFLASKLNEYFEHPENLQELSANTKACAITDAQIRLADEIEKFIKK